MKKYYKTYPQFEDFSKIISSQSPNPEMFNETKTYEK